MSDQKKTYRSYPGTELNSFEELFNLFFPRLRKYAISILHDPGEAEDLVQDVFCQLWKDRQQLDNEKNIGSFLFTILKNKCLNTLRHKIIEKEYANWQSRNKAEELYHISFGETGGFVPIEKKLMKELEDIIAGMPPKCREAFRLKWLEGKKIREIADIMKISTTMVDKHLAKGLGIAREKMPPNMFVLFFMLYDKSLP